MLSTINKILLITLFLLLSASLFVFKDKIYNYISTFTQNQNTQNNTERQSNSTTEPEILKDDTPFLDVSNLQIKDDDIKTSANAIKKAGLDSKQIAEELSDLCLKSVPEAQVKNLVATLYSYSKAKSYPLDLNALADDIKKNGTEYIYTYMKEKYSLDRDDVEEILCHAVNFANSQFDTAEESNNEINATSTEDKDEAINVENDLTQDTNNPEINYFLAENDIDYHDLSKFLSAVCKKDISPSASKDKLLYISNELGIDLNDIDISQVTPENFISQISSKFSVPQEDLQKIICN